MRWANSAFKQGIPGERSGYVVDTCPIADTVQLESNPSVDGHLHLGDDPQGMALEVIAIPIQTEDGEEDHLIIHAMRLRGRYRDRYEAIIREQWGVG